MLVCVSAVHAISFNTPYTVTDGVYITGGTQRDELRTVDAIWSLHVIVGRPEQPVGLCQAISQIQAVINSSVLARSSDKAIQSSWLQRLQILDFHLALAMATVHRHRRGLIDAGGMLLHVLFGLATTSQVDTSRRLIQQVRTHNHTILHKTNQLISIVNQTFDELVQNRQHIQAIEQSLSNLFQHIQTWQSVNDVAFETLRATIRIESVVSVLEQQELTWNRQLSRYRRQRLALMSGKLTESLLPVGDLDLILTHSRSRGFFAASPVWYYEFVGVLTSERLLRQHCKVTLHRANNAPTGMREYHANMYFVMSLGEILHIRCPGHRSRSTNLPRGTSLLRVRPGCLLSTVNWSIQAILAHELYLHYNFSLIPLTPLNWSDLISSATINRHLDSPTWKTLPQIPDIRISTLQASPEDADDDNWIMDASPMSWWPIIVVILLLVGGGVFLTIAYHRQWFRSNSHSPARSHSAPRSSPETVEMSSINAAECVTMLQTHADILASPPL